MMGLDFDTLRGLDAETLARLADTTRVDQAILDRAARRLGELGLEDQVLFGAALRIACRSGRAGMGLDELRALERQVARQVRRAA